MGVNVIVFGEEMAPGRQDLNWMNEYACVIQGTGPVVWPAWLSAAAITCRGCFGCDLTTFWVEKW